MASRSLPLFTAVPPALSEAAAAELPLFALDTLWFQLTGTLCNIACLHCFITCGPHDHRVPMMSRPRIESLLAEAQEIGVKEFYFTGGEPLLHPEFFDLVPRVLSQGPLSVLTNGILIDDPAAARLRRLFDQSRYSLDLRVSLDGMTAGQNDPVRGRGTFARITAGIAALARAGLSPVLTVVEHAEGMDAADARSRFLDFARGLGLPHPRVKFLPLLRLGREERRTRGYTSDEVVKGPLDPDVVAALQCGTSRLCTEDAVLTCLLLLDAPEARMGTTLKDSLRPIRLRWAACHTCVASGLSCKT